MRLSGILVVVFGTITTILGVLSLNRYYSDTNQCSMSYSYPTYTKLDLKSPNSKVSSKNELFLYREGGQSLRFDGLEDVANLGGTPVLFIPGNAGSYQQGRSFASLAAQKPEYDWFLLHFDEDFSALHGKTLLDEAHYANDAISFILKLYQLRDGGEAPPPSSVLVVAHSMGGIVARTLMTLDNYVEDSVNTIITLSTPHAYPPITFDRDVTQLYDLVDRWWRDKPEHIEIGLVSLAGGHNDLLVLPDMTVVDNIGGISSFSYEIPGVGFGIDHLAIVWCAEFRQAIIDAINDIVDFNSPARTLPYKQRMARISKRLKNHTYKQHGKPIQAGPSLLLGKTHRFHISKPIDILLPLKSSLVSYKVESSEPIKISHRTEKEYRDYGIQKEVTLFWYSAGPYVPYTHTTQRLTLSLEPQHLEYPVAVAVRINWMATLANVLIHYRTLAPCWPFAIVLITTIVLIHGKTLSSFGQVLFTKILNKWVFVLATVLSGLHCALLYPQVRSILRIIQVPSESANIKSLRNHGYDAADLLLGLTDIELFWISPVLLSLAVCAVVVVLMVSNAIIAINLTIQSRISSITNSERKRRGTPPPETAPNVALICLKVSALLITLYLVPYQVSTVALSIVHLLSIRDKRGIAFAISQLLLWACVVDAPIIAVWASNPTVEWLWAFASLKNIGSTLPLATYVLFITPKVDNIMSRYLAVRILTMLIMSYMVAYTFLYGGLHAFMLHHFVNYLAAWLIVVYY